MLNSGAGGLLTMEAASDAYLFQKVREIQKSSCKGGGAGDSYPERACSYPH